MDKRVLLFLSTVACSGALAVVACSSDDEATSETVDAATPDVNTTETSSPDATPDSGGPKPTGAKQRVFLANDVTTVPGSPALRLCVEATTASDEPGLSDMIDAAPVPARQGGLSMGEVAAIEFPNSLTGSSIRPVMFFEASLTAFGLADKSCKEIASQMILANDGGAGDGGSGTLIEGIDFEFSPALPRTIFKDDRTYVLLATGCPRITAEEDAIGACTIESWTPGEVSTFHTIAYELDPTTTTTSGKNRTQFIFGSTSCVYNQLYYESDPSLGVSVAYPDPNIDGGRVELIPSNYGDGGLTHPLVEDSGVLLPAPGAEVTDLRTMQALSYIFPDTEVRQRSAEEIDSFSSAIGTKISNVEPGKAYTFVFFGSPYYDKFLEDGGLNPAQGHFVLVPND